VHIVKSRFNRYFLTDFFTIFFLTGVILSCNGSNGDDGAPPGSAPPGGAPATVPAVVFIADNDSDGNKELYVALNDGASVEMLSTGGDVKDFKISPDGSRVAYRADQDTPGVIELYVNSINGGTPAKVSFLPDPVLFPGRNVEVDPLVNFDAYHWSPDNSMIAYIADQNSNDKFELFVTELNPLSNFRVSSVNIDADEDVFEFEWAPDGTLIAYRADQDFNGVIELYATQPVVINTPVKVNTPLPNAGQDVAEEPGSNADVFEWASDSSRIAYIADQSFAANDVFELWTAELVSVMPTVFAAPKRVCADLTGPGSSKDVKRFKWAPDDTRIAYLADQTAGGINELYTSLPDGSDNQKMHSDFIAGRNVTTFAWALDSSRIAYIANQDNDTVFELYTSSPDGITLPVNEKVSVLPDPVTFPGRNVTTFAWAPDSTLIAYLADQDSDDVFEIYISPPDSIVGNIQVSIDPTDPGGDVLIFTWAPDSSRIAYRAQLAAGSKR
jgi:Tol biopolymer transport system component